MKIQLSRHRKALVLLPLVAVPICIIIMLAARFTRGDREQHATDTTSMLNKTLPGPLLKEKEKTKLEAYMEQQADSLEKAKLEDRPIMGQVFDPLPPGDSITKKYYSPKKRKTATDLADQERRVNEQLNRILEQLNKPSETVDTGRYPSAVLPDTGTSPEIIRLEQMMAALNADTTQDPEMKRLDAMLDKIIRIQQPQSAQPAAKDSLAGYNPVGNSPVTSHAKTASAFYGLEQSPQSLSSQKSAIRAVVHEDQTLQDGSLVKLRLLESIYMGQRQIPEGNFIFGVCSISDERLLVDLDRIVYNSIIYPVKLSVYDTDGIPGISVPGAITRDATKQGIDRSIQTLGMTSLDPSLAAQAAGAGIESLKSLLSKKVKMVRVQLKAGHQVFLQ